MITPPDITYLGDFRGEPYSSGDDEQAQAELLLAGSTDAIWVFTGLDSDPTDVRELRILKNAICDLTLFLATQADNRTEVNSPFSSERIGSYSYSKMQQAKAAVLSGEGSGLFWLDLLFKMLANAEYLDDAYSMVSSENIFNPDGLGYPEFEMRERILRGASTGEWWEVGGPISYLPTDGSGQV